MGRRTTSPATVISIVALVFAVAGTAMASVATVSVLSKKEKKQTRNIAGGEVTKLAPNLSVKSAGFATTAGIARGLAADKLEIVSGGNAQGTNSAVANCPTGEVAVGGGGNDQQPGTGGALIASYPYQQTGNAPPSGWAVATQNAGNANTIFAIAVCVPG